MIVLMCLCLTTKVKAETSGDWEYEVNEDGNSVTIVKYNGSETELTIPATLDGKTVTVIGYETFRDNDVLTSVVMSDNSKLTKLTIGKNVKSIGASAFSGCKALKSIKIETTLLKKKAIGKKAFSGIHKKAVIKVPKKKVKEYKKALYSAGVSKTIKIK